MKKIAINTGLKDYPVLVGKDLQPYLGEFLRSLDKFEPEKLIVFSNEKVFGLYGDSLVKSLSTSGFKCNALQIPDGEEHKSFENLKKSTAFFAQSGLTRNDAVIALGGGVTGDIAGFASAIYMRGIPIVQMPTTILAMVDSSVGGKTAVNTDFGKNMIGAFHHPSAVIADVRYLKTLDLREVRSGFYELIKHGAIGGPELFDLTTGFLDKYPLADFASHFRQAGFETDLIELITAQIEQKARVVAADQYEEPGRNDSGSRKVLNFGHTVAHALEKVTEYRYFRHGEAVAYGILAATEIAKRLEYCDINSIKLLNDVVSRVGGLPDASNIDIEAVLEALVFDKKSTGKSLQWVLLKRIGSPHIVSGDVIPEIVVRESLRSVLIAHTTPDMTKE